jgi:hypothetical protein
MQAATAGGQSGCVVFRLDGARHTRQGSARVHSRNAIPHNDPAVEPDREIVTMKKILLAATALLLAGSFTAEAQRPTNPDGTPVTRSGTGTRPAATAPAPVVVVKPAPAPVKVFVPVTVPPVVAWNKSEHRYSQRNHRICQEKAHNLHSFERHAADDGFLSPRERRTIAALKSDLDRTCGGHRWGR